MAFAHSRRRWFGTCSCKPVPRGRPSSVKQLHTLDPFGPLRSWRTIIGIADHDHVPLRPLPPPLVYPQIEDVMQIDVRQQRRCYGPLWRPHLGLRPFPFFRHPRFQPFLDQPEDAPVRDPMLDELFQPFVRYVIEKTTNV